MTTAAERVRAETMLFRAALPGLLTTHAGKWVVFRDGHIQSVHDDEGDAYSAGIDAFGVDGGFVVAPVVPIKPTLMTAALAFGR
ncbi:MAG: hypothetical protein IT379_39555 [Deltaproteobacteria bacterium]|nr:hypothetical protein [Deltaproteobacteria bacterium]